MPKNKNETEICNEPKKKIKSETDTIKQTVNKTENTNNNNSKDKEDPQPSTSSFKLTNIPSEQCVTKTITTKPDYNFWQKINKGKDTKVPLVEQYIKIDQLQEGKLMKTILKIRIVYKSEIRETKVGPVFSFHGIDETGEIAFIVFGKTCILHRDKIEINDIYAIQNFLVNNENPGYPSGTGNKFQIRINADTKLQELAKNTDIAPIHFKFTKIENLQKIPKNDLIDVIGILIHDYGLETTNNGSEFRDLLLTDDTKEEIVVTCWNKIAENFSCHKYDILIIRKGTLVEYQGKHKINCLSGSLLWCNPKDIKEADTLSSWFETEIKDVTQTNL